MLPTFSAAVTGNVYAFEPVLENYILANLCMQHNELKNVLLFHSALGAETQNLRINTKEFDGQHRGGASAIDSVGSLCLANSIDSLPIQNLTMIQLDIEGFELQALLGATDTIREQRPIVAIEDNHNNCSEFLDNSQYEHRLSIPGLEIWSPAENIDYAEALAAFAQSFSTPA